MDAENKAIEEAEKDLKPLFESLQRTGGHWDEYVHVYEVSEGIEAIFRLRSRLPPGAGPYVRGYVKEFLKERGWKVRTQLTPQALAIALSKAESSFSKKDATKA